MRVKAVKELVIGLKCRKGPAAGTTKHGAFWHALRTPTYEGSSELVDGVLIRSYGGDGVGQNRPDLKAYLELRHYRNGEVGAVVRVHSWHQNSGSSDRWTRVDEVLLCETIEEIIVVLKQMDETVYGDSTNKLEPALVALGLPVSAPSPDEA